MNVAWLLEAAPSADVAQTAIAASITAFLAYLTGKRVRGQDSGWQRLVDSANRTVSNQQRTITDQASALAKVRTENDRLHQVINRLRHEAATCPHEHELADSLTTGELPLVDLGEG